MPIKRHRSMKRSRFCIHETSDFLGRRPAGLDKPFAFKFDLDGKRTFSGK